MREGVCDCAVRREGGDVAALQTCARPTAVRARIVARSCVRAALCASTPPARTAEGLGAKPRGVPKDGVFLAQL